MQSNALTDKQVKHDVGDDDVEGAEVDERSYEVAAVRLPVVVGRSAVRRLDHAVVHDLVPVLSRHDAEQHGHPRHRRAKVSPPATTDEQLLQKYRMATD